MTNLRKIAERLDAPELLTQLAEEASELVQAALKLRRALTGTNPTPTPPSKAMTDLVEEIADVENVIHVVGEVLPISWSMVADIGERKLRRWAKRLEDRHG